VGPTLQEVAPPVESEPRRVRVTTELPSERSCGTVIEGTWTTTPDGVIRVRDMEGRLFTERLGPNDDPEHVREGYCVPSTAATELATGRLHVRRAKNGSPSFHPMQGDEIRALRRLRREQGPSSHVFMTERDGPMTPKAFHALWVGSGRGPRCNSRYIRTCCGMAAATP
jgi:hypothetical protein